MEKLPTIKVKKLNPNALIPKYETAQAAGFDLRCTEGGSIESGKSKLIGTGLAMELPEGYELQIRPRSGLALKHSITVLNSPGTVDADYRGEIKVLLINHGTDIFTYSAGDRIAQGVVMKLPTPVVLYEETELSATDRGEGGFGSTGMQWEKYDKERFTYFEVGTEVELREPAMLNIYLADHRSKKGIINNITKETHVYGKGYIHNYDVMFGDDLVKNIAAVYLKRCPK